MRRPRVTHAGSAARPARGRASRALFADDGNFELRRDVVMEPNRHRGLAERLDRLVQRDPPALDLDPVPLQELHDVLRGHRAEELALLGGLPALLEHEGLDPLAQRLGLALDAARLVVLIRLDVLDVLYAAGGRADG